MDNWHRPVLSREAIEALGVKAGGRYVDCTFGFGGHTAEILRRGGQVLGLDVEEKGYEEFVRRQKTEGGLIFRRENFSKLDEVLKEVGWEKVDGVLYDLGTSSWELEGSGRGFTYLKDEPLDMRLDSRLGVTAADLVNALPEKDLYEIFKNFGEEPGAFRLARSTHRASLDRPIKTTKELREALGTTDIKVLSRIFQALRIAVNNELEDLQNSLNQAATILKPGGRLVVISFQSLEDRIVKNLGKEFKNLQPVGELVTPSTDEVAANPKSRSAKMRVFAKLPYEVS